MYHVTLLLLNATNWITIAVSPLFTTDWQVLYANRPCPNNPMNKLTLATSTYMYVCTIFMYMYMYTVLNDIHECTCSQISGATYLLLINVNRGSLNKDL